MVEKLLRNIYSFRHNISVLRTDRQTDRQRTELVKQKKLGWCWQIARRV